jgi:NAD(P)H-dependent FMN reductase
MNKPNIGIIISTTRGTRMGADVAAYAYSIAQQRDDLTFEIVDLRDYPLPFFDEPASNATVPASHPEALKWQKKVAQFDGFIFVVAEYNGSITAVLKNALDYANPEWVRKPAAFFAYGSIGGSRAVQHLKEICIELQMAPVRHSVLIQGADFFSLYLNQKKVDEFTYLIPLVNDMLDQLSWWTYALKRARAS